MNGRNKIVPENYTQQSSEKCRHLDFACVYNALWYVQHAEGKSNMLKQPHAVFIDKP